MYVLRATGYHIEGSFLLEAGPNRIGRSEHNQIVLKAPGISRRHATIHVTDQGLVLEDHGSLNGTFLGNRSIKRAPIREGMPFSLAAIQLTIEAVAPEDSRLAISLGQPMTEGEVAEPHWAGPDPETSTLVLCPEDGIAPDSAGLSFPDGYCRGDSPGLQKTYRQMRAALRGERPVLILGETGVGKEMAVETLHLSSRRHRGPLVAINCAAIPSTLLEAELFGIGKGVASGVDARQGRFREAEGGTLFLDEIGEMEPELQAKLLRALQSDEIQPVGSAPTMVDVRVIAASNLDLQEKIVDGSFRADLYYRLAAHLVEIPPLRHRRQDIPHLVEHFLRQATEDSRVAIRGVTTGALRLLTDYPWPGNIRQLEHEIHRLVCSGHSGAVIGSRSLPDHILHPRLPRPSTLDDELTEPLALEPKILEVEKSLIREALRRTGGNKSQAAELLGISRNGLAKKMKRLEVEYSLG